MFSLPKLIGHRGVKDLSPENTLESIQLAKDLGLKWVEIDVKISKDCIPILLHDNKLNRTTNGYGFPIEFNYEKLKKLDAGFFFYKRPTNIHIPTLRQILFYCKKNKIGLNIEIKPNIGFGEKTVDSIVKLFKELEFSSNIFFSSFDWNLIISMQKMMPNFYYGLLIDKFTEKINLKYAINIIKKYNFLCCGLNKKITNKEILFEINSNNIYATVYSDKNILPNEAYSLWKNGVKSIFTDDPTKFNISKS